MSGGEMFQRTSTQHSQTSTTSTTLATHRQVVKIRLPDTTDWEPSQAEYLMEELFSLRTSLNLVIRMETQSIGWSIEVGKDDVKSVTSRIDAIYNDAQISQESKSSLDIDYFCYQIEAMAPFIGPIKTVYEVSGVDPLTSLTSVARRLQADEVLVYELILVPSIHNYIWAGNKMLTKTQVRFDDYFSVERMAQAQMEAAVGANRVQKYAPEIDTAAREKTQNPLMEGFMFVKIKANSSSRAEALLNPTMRFFRKYMREGFNGLMIADAKSFPLVLSQAEAAALWHLPTKQMKEPGVIWVT